MDPHSTRSQFNRRTPKAGPLSRTTSEKQDNSKMLSKKKAKTDSLLIRRPIATNSRIKQDETMKRNMYLSFVNSALQQKLAGQTQSFDDLVTQFNLFSTASSSAKQNHSRIDTAEIRLWISALSHVVSRLERTHATLVHAIVNMPWSTLDTATVKSYTLFIGMLLSARPEYLSLVLAKIALGFTYQSGKRAFDSELPSTSKATLTRRTVYERMHYLLRHLLCLVPTLPSTLHPLLVRHFPHKRQHQLAHTTYIRNLLTVSSYCPELADKILATIVDRAIQIDVEIQIDLEEIEEEQSLEDNDVFDFELDPFDLAVDEGPASDSDSEDDNEKEEDTFSDLSSEAGDLDDVEPIEVQTNMTQIKDMVKKLDAILVLLFQHFERTRVTSVGEIKSMDPTYSSPAELPPLPPLDLSTPGLSSRFTQMLGPPYTQIAGFDPLSISPTPTPPLPTPDPTSSIPTLKGENSINQEKCKVALRTQFHTLLSIFDRTILRTFKSRYTQFLLFWCTSIDPEFADIFQGMLVDRALMSSSGPAFLAPNTQNDDNKRNESSTNPNVHMLTPEVTRAAAASYIGSFVSRATFVDLEGTRRVVGVLCEFLRAHLDGVDQALQEGAFDASASSILASGQHLVFYAVVQAVFLIFCFRWRDLMADGGDDEEELGPIRPNGAPRQCASIGTGKGSWISELSILKRAVVSVLNPLKVCSSNVVLQFTRIAQAAGFLYCQPIVEANRRSESLNSSPPRGGTDSIQSFNQLNPAVLFDTTNIAELNTFFPFDPCRLPKSNGFIQAVYREWESVAIQETDDADEDEDDEDEGGSEESLEIVSDGRLAIPSKKASSTASLDDATLGDSLGAMSISPAPRVMPMSASMRG